MSLEVNTGTNHHTCHPEHPNILACTHGLFLSLYKSLCVTCTNIGTHTHTHRGWFSHRGDGFYEYCAGVWGGLESGFHLSATVNMIHTFTPPLL